MNIIHLRFKSLIKKMSFMRSDLEYHRAEHENRRKIFYDDVAAFLEDSNFKFSEEKTVKNMIDIYKKEEAVPVEKLSMENKKLFKEIAKKTHPDLHGDEERNKMFKKAVAAVETGDWYTIYDIASALDVDVPDPSKEHVSWLKQEIKKIESTIANIKTTFEWKYCEDSANKQQLLTTYCMITCTLKEVNKK